MNPTTGVRVLLGVGGGIAAYKAADLVRRLREQGCEVRVVLTQAAGQFVSPLTFQALSGHPARSALLDPAAEAGMDHIELARWAERLVIAPATADLIARVAAGLADDLLTTLCLATEAPVFIAPAMNRVMWEHPATQTNVATLVARGAVLLGPGSGSQACGETGPGRLLEPAEIAARVSAASEPTPAQTLADVRVLITAGPTREPIDPVRFIGNRSSGRMGYALAEALAGLGARVVLVSGPVSLPAPRVAEIVRVDTAMEMHAAVMTRVVACDLFAATAAVADYRPAEPASAKLKKNSDTLDVHLVRNPDILADVAARPDPPFTLGFAAETDDLETHALLKLKAKGIDMIAANRVAGAEGGFEAEDNALIVLWPNGRRELPLMPKPRLARALADLIAERFRAPA
jgi:phosphopantothenoylcysteine decarboxylase/phosphopantothenate--cysteine ligase